MTNNKTNYFWIAGKTPDTFRLMKRSRSTNEMFCYGFVKPRQHKPNEFVFEPSVDLHITFEMGIVILSKIKLEQGRKKQRNYEKTNNSVES